MLNTPITDAGLAHLSGMKSLRTLDLRGGKITDASLDNLSGLSGLRNLWLKNTTVTDAGIAKLKKALPQCRVTK